MDDASTDPPTIVALKQSFLEHETRALAQPLAPSATWRRKNDLRGGAGDDAKKSRLPPRLVDDALVRVNQTLQQHARRVYAPQAVRHVAEQLEQLYMQGAQRDRDEHIAGPSCLTTESALELPAVWDDAVAAEQYPAEARRYAEQVARVQTLAARRADLEARVERLRAMQSLLGGLGQAQDSLVTRDGPVERALERTRLLLVRVGDKVASLPASSEPVAGGDGDGETDAETMDAEAAGRQRVQALLGQY